MRGPDPPSVLLTAEMRWALLRAYGPRDSQTVPPVDPERSTELLRQLALTTRVAARTSREQLEADLGPEATRKILQIYLDLTVRHLRLVEEISRLAHLAAEISVPLVFLKFAALHLSGVIDPGQREARDLDVLAPEERLQELAETLDQNGYRADAPPSSEQHIASRRSPDGLIIEPHLKVLGVRPPSESESGTVESLTRHRALHRLPDLPGSCSVPVPEVLCAHAIVHALVQHGLDPGGYPPTRMIGDLIDLGFATLENRDGVSVWIDRDVPPSDVTELQILCQRLKAGDVPESGFLDDAASRWLRHVLAGRLDADYKRSLRLKLFRAPLGDGPRGLLRVKEIVRAVFPNRRQIDAIYGPQQNGLGYALRRILRPFDLVHRTVRSTTGLIRMRRRDPGGGSSTPDPSARS